MRSRYHSTNHVFLYPDEPGHIVYDVTSHDSSSFTMKIGNSEISVHDMLNKDPEVINNVLQSLIDQLQSLLTERKEKSS